MSSSFKYKLLIKGRDAIVGDTLWWLYSDGRTREFEIKKIVICASQPSKITIKFKDNGEEDFFFTGSNRIMSSMLFWEKPIIYQLPDTDGNLSEVKIGQHVWIKYKESSNICEYLINRFNGDDIKIKYINGDWSNNITNKEGLTASGEQATTNKPSRFHGKQDWSQAPEKAVYWGIDNIGDSYWFEEKPSPGRYMWHSLNTCDKNAGYRNDLIDDRENIEVTDWRDSLVMRPLKIM